MFSLPVHLIQTTFSVHTPQMSTYGTASDPQSPLHDSSAEIVTPKGNYTPLNNQLNPVPNVLANLDSDPSLSDSY